MSIQQKVFTALDAIAAFSHRIYPNYMPEQPTYPALTYQFVGNQPAPGYIASARRTEWICQVTLYEQEVPAGGGYTAALTNRLAVIAAFEAMPECESRVNDIESGFEFQTRTYSWILTFRLMDIES